MMTPDHLHVVGALVGNLVRDPAAHIKYGPFFAALARQVTLVSVFDASLRGIRRLGNALASFHPNKRCWRERFYKNPAAFQQRSQQVGEDLQQVVGTANVALQVGVLFDATRYQATLPVVIYTDYTAALSARKPAAGRSPFSSHELGQWLRMEHEAYSRASHICTRSHFVRRSLLEDYGLPAGCVSVVGGGVNFDPLPPQCLPGPGLPIRTAAVPTALYIGKEYYRKGGDLLLEAFLLATRSVPQARLLLVTERRPPYLPPGVHWIAPTWQRPVIASLYRQADLFVLPSRLETWGDVLLEAMAFGLPCIGVATDAIGEIVENQVTGLLVPPDDVDALANALVCLFENAPLRQTWGANGRRRVETHFLWSQVVYRMLPVLRSSAASTIDKVTQVATLKCP
jgi:glycosyltransferase involved in cell wall biosynthesis